MTSRFALDAIERQTHKQGDETSRPISEFLQQRPHQIYNTKSYRPYNADYREGVDQEREGIDVVVLHRTQPLPAELPEGYAFSGGVARNCMLAELGQAVPKARDIDIVAVSNYSPDMSLSDSLSKNYMPDDYSHGHGITVTDLGTYFESRDFTINEVLATNKLVHISQRALEDLHSKTIRATPFEAGKWLDYELDMEGLHPKLIIKALRLAVEFEHIYGKSNLDQLQEWLWQFDHIPAFYLALGLNKAYQLGDALATRFYAKLLELGIIGAKEDGDRVFGADTREVAFNIRYKMGEEGHDPFVFDNELLNSDSLDLPESLMMDEMYRHYAELANTYNGKGKGFLEEY